MDPRIQHKRDIELRVSPDLRPKCSTRFSHSRLWSNFEGDRIEMLSAATETGVGVEAKNSLSWGLVDPTRGEAGGRIRVPKSPRPKTTRDNAPFIRNVLWDSGSNGFSCEAAVPRAFQQISAVRAQMPTPQVFPLPGFPPQAMPPSEQAISLTQKNRLSDSGSNNHYSEADPAHVPRPRPFFTTSNST